MIALAILALTVPPSLAWALSIVSNHIVNVEKRRVAELEMHTSAITQRLTALDFSVDELRTEANRNAQIVDHLVKNQQ